MMTMSNNHCCSCNCCQQQSSSNVIGNCLSFLCCSGCCRKQQLDVINKSKTVKAADHPSKNKKRDQRKRKWHKPFLLKLLESKNTEYRFTKMLFDFPLGLLMAYGAYRLTIQQMDLNPHEMVKYGLVFILGSASLFTLFVTFRCIAFLTIPTLCTHPGRLFINAILVQQIISGPVNSMLYNAQEVARGFICGFELHANQSKTHWQLRLVPIIDIMVQLQIEDQDESDYLKQKTNNVDRELQQSSRTQLISKKYSNGLAGNVAKIARFYREKLDLRCSDLFTMGILACKQKFHETEKACLEKLPIVGYLLCLPLKFDFICELLKLFQFVIKNHCNSYDAMQAGFETQFDSAQRVASNMDKDFQASMFFKSDDVENDETDAGLGDDSDDSSASSIDDMKAEIIYKLHHHTALTVFFLKLVNKMMTFIFVYLVYSAHKYLVDFIIDINFDNKYVTSYFQHVDKRRSTQGKRTLLPLKKLEKTEIVPMFSLSVAGKDRSTVTDNSMHFLLKTVFILVIIAIDYVFYEVLELVIEYGHIDYHQEGNLYFLLVIFKRVHHIGIFVAGSGIIAKMLRIMFKGFNATTTIDNYTSTDECLPRPRNTTSGSLKMVALLVAIEWASILLEPYLNRTRALVAGFFFVKRNKQRTLHLYNNMLRKREAFLQQVRHKVRKTSQRQQLSVDIGLLPALRYLFPRFCRWTVVFRACGIGREKCLICEERETKEFVHCPTRGCRAIYCRQCWLEVHMKCYACRDEDDWSYSNDRNP